MNIENHIYGDGAAQPEGLENFQFLNPIRAKNEYKGKAFIATKHVIESATEKTFISATRYVELYLMLNDENTVDKSIIKSLLQIQFRKIYPNT